MINYMAQWKFRDNEDIMYHLLCHNILIERDIEML